MIVVAGCTQKAAIDYLARQPLTDEEIEQYDWIPDHEGSLIGELVKYTKEEIKNGRQSKSS